MKRKSEAGTPKGLQKSARGCGLSDRSCLAKAEGMRPVAPESCEGGGATPGEPIPKNFLNPVGVAELPFTPVNSKVQKPPSQSNRFPATRTELSSLLFEGARTVLSLDEIAAKLDCSKRHIIQLIESGAIGAINIGRGRIKFYRVPIGEWEKFLRRRASI
jgi:excisionase family DNA binding protein